MPNQVWPCQQECWRAHQLSLWRQAVTTYIDRVETALAKAGIAVHNNEIFTFQEVAARGKHRFDLRLDLATPILQEVQSMAQSAPWMPLVHKLLGVDVDVITSVVYSRPGADNQARCTPLTFEHVAHLCTLCAL